MERPLDAIIREAEKNGAFDNLPGKGKPQRIDQDTTPDELRMGYTVLRNSGYVPHEVELMKEIEGLQERLAASSDQTERAALRKRIEEKRLQVNLFLESLRK